MIEKIWSGKSVLFWLLLPFSLLYGGITYARRWCYQRGILAVWRAPVPVVVVGNINAGGSGKTPLVIWLVAQLTERGYRVGVVSRGYGGQADAYPLLLNSETTPQEAGDEPVLIYQRTGVPVAVAPLRRHAVEAILAKHKVDLIITDDGLQHYGLARDCELVVIDGIRRFGNGWWLPAGPMRERASRLEDVDALITNGGDALAGEFPMQLVANEAINLVTGERKAVADLTQVVAMAGIGHPPRFKKTLEQLQVTIEQFHAFVDHYAYREEQLSALVKREQQLLMTEKDAVKCRSFAHDNWWYLPVDAKIEPAQATQLIEIITHKLQH